MEIKDWVLLLVPILANGIIIWLFQKIFESKFERMSKRSSFRDDVIMCFYQKVQNLNDTMIQMNVSVTSNPDSVSVELNKTHMEVLKIFKYYDSNKYDLDVFEKEFDAWKESWNTFETTVQEYSNRPLTPEMKQKLGEQLQHFKDMTDNLMNIIRKKY